MSNFVIFQDQFVIFWVFGSFLLLILAPRAAGEFFDISSHEDICKSGPPQAIFLNIEVFFGQILAIFRGFQGPLAVFRVFG